MIQIGRTEGQRGCACAHQMLVARLGHNVKLVDPCVGFGYVVTNAGQNLVVIDARTP